MEGLVGIAMHAETASFSVLLELIQTVIASRDRHHLQLVQFAYVLDAGFERAVVIEFSRRFEQHGIDVLNKMIDRLLRLGRRLGLALGDALLELGLPLCGSFALSS